MQEVDLRLEVMIKQREGLRDADGDRERADVDDCSSLSVKSDFQANISANISFESGDRSEFVEGGSIGVDQIHLRKEST